MSSDSDIAKAFRAMREDGKERRARNRDNAPNLLTEAGLLFEAKNDGAHLIVHTDAETVDFWPGTGKWIARKSGARGRGVFHLIEKYRGE